MEKFYVIYWLKTAESPLAVFELMEDSKDEAEELAFDEGGFDDYICEHDEDEIKIEVKKEKEANLDEIAKFKTDPRVDYINLVERAEPGWHFEKKIIKYKKSKNKDAEIRFWSNEGNGCHCYNYLGAYVYWKDRKPYITDLSCLEPEELNYLYEQIAELAKEEK